MRTTTNWPDYANRSSEGRDEGNHGTHGPQSGVRGVECGVWSAECGRATNEFGKNNEGRGGGIGRCPTDVEAAHRFRTGKQRNEQDRVPRIRAHGWGEERGEKRRGAEGQRRRARGFEGQPSVQNSECRIPKERKGGDGIRGKGIGAAEFGSNGIRARTAEVVTTTNYTKCTNRSSERGAFDGVRKSQCGTWRPEESQRIRADAPEEQPGSPNLFPVVLPEFVGPT